MFPFKRLIDRVKRPLKQPAYNFHLPVVKCGVCDGFLHIQKLQDGYYVSCSCGEGFKLCDECARKLETVWKTPEEYRKVRMMKLGV